MKKMTIRMIMTFAILFALTSLAFADEILGYPIVPKQAKFYTMILGLMGASMAMVGAVYGYLWLADLKKKKVQELKIKGSEVFIGKLAAHHAQ